MLTLPPSVRIYVATAPCDMRKQFDGIALLVEQQLQLHPRSGHLFVVFNRRGDQVRILFWEHAEQGLRETEQRLVSNRAATAADVNSKKQKREKALFDVRQTERNISRMTLRAPVGGTPLACRLMLTENGALVCCAARPSAAFLSAGFPNRTSDRCCRG